MGSARRAALIALCCGLFVASGTAASATTATILSPANGSHVSNGFTGPIDVTFDNDLTPGTFTVAVNGPTYTHSQQVVVDEAGTVGGLAIPAATTPGSYAIEVDEGATQIAANTFTVDAVEHISITNPVNGELLNAPASPKLTVLWTTVGADGDDYSVDLMDGASTLTSCPYIGGAVEGTTTSCETGPLGDGTYQVRVRNETTGDTVDTSTFTVAPHVRVSATSVSPSIFLPYERDGVRDHTTGRFTLNIAARAFVRVRNRSGRVVRHRTLGTLGAGAHSWRWTGKNDNGRLVAPGRFTITFSARSGGLKDAGRARAVRAQIGLHLRKSSVAPVDFYPIKRDGFRDATSFSFTTNRRSNDRLEVKNGSGRVIRHINLGYKGAGRHHAIWRGTNDSGSKVAHGSYRIRVVAKTALQTKASHWLTVRVHKGPTSGGGGGGGDGGDCTPGYSPCLRENHGGADYDCAGGSGDGPYYTKPGVVYSVTGSDPYRLDSDNDGRGCE